MHTPDTSKSTAPEASNIIPFPTPTRPPGRPTICTQEVTDTICAAIRLDGMSDTSAGYLAGVSSSTTSRWKQDDEDFAISLGQARAEYDRERLRVIRGATKPDGSPDWRAHGWLLQKSSPDKFGPPPRRRKAAAKAEEEEPPRDPDHPVVTTKDLIALQAAREVSLKKIKIEHDARVAAEAEAAAANNPPNIPETPKPGFIEQVCQAIGSGSPEPAKPNGAKIPETPAVASSTAKSDGANIPETPAAAPAKQSAKIPETPAAPAPARPLTPREIAESNRAKFEAERRIEDEIEEWRRITESIVNAPDPHPQSCYDEAELRKDPSYIPGMWTSY